MVGYSEISLALITLITTHCAADRTPPHQQSGALEECLAYITSPLDGGLSYCQNSCRDQYKARNLDSRCSEAGRVNLLDCTAYREPACEQSRAGQVGVGSDASSTPSSTPPHQQTGALEECLEYISSPLDGGLFYCQNSCRSQYNAKNLDSRCQRAGKTNLLDCTAYREPACEQKRAGQIGVGTSGSGADGEDSSHGSDSSEGLQDVRGCESAINAADGSRKMNNWCQERCQWFADNSDLTGGCKYYGKTTLTECVDWVEDLCVASGRSGRTIS